MNASRRNFLEMLSLVAAILRTEDALPRGNPLTSSFSPQSMSFFESEMNTRWEIYHIGGTQRANKGLDLWMAEIESLTREYQGTEWQGSLRSLMSLSYQLQGSLYRDLMNYSAAHISYDMAFAIANELDDSEFMASARARKGVTYIQQHDPLNAIQCLSSAYGFLENAELPYLKGYILQAFSEAHAMNLDGKSSRHYIYLAQKTLESSVSRTERSHCSLNATSIMAQTGVNTVLLKDYPTAIRLLEEGLKKYSPALTRGRARLIAQKAEAYYGLTETGQKNSLDECVSAAEEALHLARDAGSTKTVSRIQDLYKTLQQSPWKEERGVVRLGDLLSQKEEYA